MNRSAAVIRIAMVAMDQIIRAAILERALGQRPGLYQRAPMMAFDQVQRIVPDINPIWVARDSGAYLMLIKRITSVLKNPQRAEDLASEIISGLTVPTPGGELGLIGDIMKGRDLSTTDSFRKAMTLLLRHAQQRAISATRGKQNQMESDPETMRLGPGQSEDGQTDLGDTGKTDPVMAILDMLEGPRGAILLDKLMDMWERYARPSDVDVMRVWLEDPTRSNVDVARIVGERRPDGKSLSGSYVGQAMKRLVAVAEQRLTEIPGIEALLDEGEMSPRRFATSEARALAKILRKVLGG